MVVILIALLLSALTPHLFFCSLEKSIIKEVYHASEHEGKEKIVTRTIPGEYGPVSFVVKDNRVVRICPLDKTYNLLPEYTKQ